MVTIFIKTVCNKADESPAFCTQHFHQGVQLMKPS